MLSLFYLTGVRTFEGTTSNMSSIHRSASGTWWLTVLGKRNKIRDVPISDELYQDLQQYREAFGLPRDIPAKDATPSSWLPTPNSNGPTPALCSKPSSKS